MFNKNNILKFTNMKLKFKKIRLNHVDMGLPTGIEELNDEIIVDFSLLSVKEVIKGKELEKLWPYSKISKTRLKGIYSLYVGEKGYCNDWNFKPTGMKKLVVLYYLYKERLINPVIGGIVGGVISNIIFYILTPILKFFIS